jgi:hypothetical protein
MSTDRMTVRIVVTVLGAIAFVVVAGGIYLADHDKSLTDAVIAMGSAALGGLSTFLVSSSTRTDAPQPVNVVNPPDEPVPVEPGA